MADQHHFKKVVAVFTLGTLLSGGCQDNLQIAETRSIEELERELQRVKSTVKRIEKEMLTRTLLGSF